MSEIKNRTLEEILARARGEVAISNDTTKEVITLPEPTPLEISKIEEPVKEDEEEEEEVVDPKQYLLDLIDIIFPITQEPIGGLVSDREYALLFAEITNYDHIRCERIFTNATLFKEMLDIGYAQLLIYKGLLTHGKMGI